MKPLKRSLARATLSLQFAGWGMVLFDVFFQRGLRERYGSDWPGYLGITLMLLGLLLWHGLARCPRCGKGGVPQTWSYQGRRYCSHCGEVLLFDDASEEAGAVPVDRRARLTLRRGWARATFALAMGGTVLLALGVLALNASVRTQDVQTSVTLNGLGGFLLLAGIAVWGIELFLGAKHLRCPGCGEALAFPWRRGPHWCRHCGAELTRENEELGMRN